MAETVILSLIFDCYGARLTSCVDSCLSADPAGSSVDVGALLGQAVGGGVAGAVVTAVVGLIKNKMA
jgi:hypothetical protein